MPATIMTGRDVANRIRTDAARLVAHIRQSTGVTPTLATVLVGDDPASAAYVRTKRAACDKVAMRSLTIELPDDATTAQVLIEVERLALDPSVHAILVQHPVPAHVDRRAVFEAIPLAKDIDAVSSCALGRVILGISTIAPCTPLGIMRLLAEYQVDLDGLHAVVIGRSPILGRPLASMLVNAHATVTLCHSRTRDLAAIARQADLLIAAVGKPAFVQGGWIKPGAVVIDAGYNEGNVGDVDFEAAAERASLITPVPGGVGPVTVAVLIEQAAKAAAERHKGTEAQRHKGW